MGGFSVWDLPLKMHLMAYRNSTSWYRAHCFVTSSYVYLLGTPNNMGFQP